MYHLGDLSNVRGRFKPKAVVLMANILRTEVDSDGQTVQNGEASQQDVFDFSSGCGP